MADAQSRSSWVAVIVGTAVFSIAAAFRLGWQSLWGDEGFTAALIRLPFEDVGTVIWRREGNGSLHTVLLWFLTRIGDSTEAWLRSTSVLGGAISVALVIWCAGRVWGTNAAWYAAAGSAVAPYLLDQAQTARAGMLTTAFVTAASVALQRAGATGSCRWLMTWSIAIGLSVYGHSYGFLVLAAHALVILSVRPPRPLSTRTVVLAASVAAGIAAPMAAYLAVRDSGQLAWIEDPSPRSMLGTLVTVSGSKPLLVVWIVAVSFAARSVTQVALGQGRQVDSSMWFVAIALAWLVVPWFLAAAYSVVVTPILDERYVIVLVPAAVLLIARLGTVLDRYVPMPALVAAIVGLSFWAAVQAPWWRAPPNEDWRAATAHVASRLQHTDQVVFVASWPQTADYYLKRSNVTVRPDQLYGGSDVVGHASTGDLSATDVVDRWLQKHDHPGRLWIMAFDPRHRSLDELLSAIGHGQLLPHCRSTTHTTFTNLTVASCALGT